MQLIDLVLFMAYSYAGATLEHLNYWFSDVQKALANPVITGFPIYGIGAYLAVAVYQLLDSWLPITDSLHVVLLFLANGLVLSVLEYVMGRIAGAGPSSYRQIQSETEGSRTIVDSWDYSREPYNYQGIVSLRHFVAWGILGLLVVPIHYRLYHMLQPCLG